LVRYEIAACSGVLISGAPKASTTAAAKVSIIFSSSAPSRRRTKLDNLLHPDGEQDIALRPVNLGTLGGQPLREETRDRSEVLSGGHTAFMTVHPKSGS
jgi:hypothetical protein